MKTNGLKKYIFSIVIAVCVLTLLLACAETEDTARSNIPEGYTITDNAESNADINTTRPENGVEQSDGFETLPQDDDTPVRKGEYHDYYCVAAVEAPGSFVPTDTSIFSAIEYKNPNAAAERSFDIFGVRYDSVYSKSVLIGGSDVRIDVYSIPEYENCELWLIENSDQIVGYISIPNTVGMFDKEEDYLAVIHDITGDIPDHLTYECYTFYWSSEVSSVRSRYEKGYRVMTLNERVKSRDFFYYNYLSDSLKDDGVISASFWEDTITVKMIPSTLSHDDIEGITEETIADKLIGYHRELDRESMSHKLFKMDGHIFSYTTAEGSIYHLGEKFGVFGEFILKIK